MLALVKSSASHLTQKRLGPPLLLGVLATAVRPYCLRTFFAEASIDLLHHKPLDTIPHRGRAFLGQQQWTTIATKESSYIGQAIPLTA